ncbi:MAG: EAL domain-containing protein [Pseudomonadales bacterium]
MAERRRTLVRELLYSQLAFAAIVGLIALGCVWWVTNWVVRDNLDDWASRWIGEMETLGAGLYADRADERFLQLEGYLSRFPEIAYIRYYDIDGGVVYTESASETPAGYPALTADERDQLVEAAFTTGRHLTQMTEQPLVRISQAVATQSIVSANLLTARSLEELETRADVIGFVELGLDYSAYDRGLMSGIVTGSAFLMLAFLLLLLAGRVLLRRAVQPLADLQKPLERMARGELDLSIPESPHREIAAISEALQTAAEKIRERDRHLRRLANFDPLTGLASRHHFLELLAGRLEQGEKNGAGGALLFLDLDQFKYVNDTHGHPAGDAVLAQVAERLRQSVRLDDLIGRFGGDEFLLFVSDVGVDRAEGIARKLMSDLREYPLSYEGISFTIHCSVGIAMVDNPAAYAPEELLSNADVACREAKSLGRNRSALYQAGAGEAERLRSDLSWQQRLKAALKDDGFELHYQPIMQLSNNTVGHYEVLLRMKDGDSLVYPDRFLTAAERFGLMQEIDYWVIDHALAALSRARGARPGVCFSINLTGSAFVDGTLVEYVRLKLLEHAVDPGAVIFEITEQVAIGSFADAVGQIRELRKLGVEFAVDDFGTGYSSLSYLKRLPVQYIKIDGVFIQRLVVNRADQTIVRAIADIARIMGKRTVAEFVGDEATLTLIREIGIDYGQGFHIGKPAPVLPASPSGKVVPLHWPLKTQPRPG